MILFNFYFVFWIFICLILKEKWIDIEEKQVCQMETLLVVKYSLWSLL